MNVGILGLGLIGGSLARAYSKSGHNVYVHDTDKNMLVFAQLTGTVQAPMTTDIIAKCQLIFLAIYPNGCITWLQDNAKYIRKETVVIDCSGIKAEICNQCFPIAEKYGFTFVGAHPMAGSHNSGFKYSRSNLFHGAPMILVPPRFDDISLLSYIKELLEPCHFGSFSVTTAEDHDRMIAFTSQMPHILSNAFIKSPTALKHKGFSAGSYKDLTRVAWLNPQMWAELFSLNKENLLFELDCYINSLLQYRNALEQDNITLLTELLDQGKKRKEQVDG